jgi:DNA-binding LacI/PurR family transcriptional regulator
MNIQINNEDRNPIYLQLVEQIGNLVLCGDLKAGDKLPSVRELSVELGINPNTVARAYRDLQYKEVINSRRTEGTFITDKLSELSSPERKRVMANSNGSLSNQSKNYGLASEAVMKAAGTLISSSGLQQVSVRENKFAVLAIRSEGHIHEDLNRHLVNNLQKKGIIPVSVHLDENKKSMERGLDEVMSLKPASIIIDGASGNNIMDYLEAKSDSFDSAIFIITKPLNISEKFKSHSVISDNWYGAYMATKHLIGLGHKKIMMMTHRWRYTPELYRLSVECKFEDGYRAALKEAGLQEFEQQFYDCSDIESNKSEFLKLLKSKKRPTAIVSSEDFRITTKQECFRKAGIRIPEDMSVIGYYNTPWSTVTDIQLTSVSIKEDEIALKIAEILSGENKSSEIVVKPELVVRKSCGPLGK